MATIAVLQLGNAIAGSAVPSVGVGNSLLCTLTLLDSVTQAPIVADVGSVTAILQPPVGNNVALAVTSPSAGVYLATATVPLAGTYFVSFSATTGAGAFTLDVLGEVLSIAQVPPGPVGSWALFALPDATPSLGSVQALAGSWVPCDARTGSVTVLSPVNPTEGAIFAVADIWGASTLNPILVLAQGVNVTIANPSVSAPGSLYGASATIAQQSAVQYWRYSATLLQWRFAF